MSLNPDNQEPRVEKVTLLNKHGERLVGLLHETGSVEIIILCHGFQSSKEFKIMSNLSASLEKEGISSFRFDFSGNGESEGSFMFGDYLKEVDDLHSVIQHFRTTNRVISAILGHSKGGDVVILYASIYRDVPRVFNISGRYDLNEGIAQRLGGDDYLQRITAAGFIDVTNNKGEVGYRVTKEDVIDRVGVDVPKACVEMPKQCKVWTVHGSEDEAIPVGDARKFDSVIPNHELHIIEGADHCYNSHQAELVHLLLPFLLNSTLHPQA